SRRTSIAPASPSGERDRDRNAAPRPVERARVVASPGAAPFTRGLGRRLAVARWIAQRRSDAVFDRAALRLAAPIGLAAERGTALARPVGPPWRVAAVEVRASRPPSNLEAVAGSSAGTPRVFARRSLVVEAALPAPVALAVVPAARCAFVGAVVPGVGAR